VKKKQVLLYISIFFIVQTSWPQGRFTDGAMAEALSNMDKAFAETDAELTAKDEYYLGRATAASILARYRPYTGNRELTNYVNKICQVIAINSPLPEIYNGYHVVILNSTEYNAFATPGGHILITKALIEAAPSEDALAGIIAHELAHIQLRHGIALIDSMKLNDQFSAIADRAADFAGRNSPTVKKTTEFRNSVSALIDGILLNGYSQAQEFEADKQAARLLTTAGYDPWAFIEMLNVLILVQRKQAGGFNKTHPSPEQRIARLEGTIVRRNVNDALSYRTSRFKKIVKR